MRVSGIRSSGGRTNTGHKTGLRGRRLWRRRAFTPLAPLAGTRPHAFLVRAVRERIGKYAPTPLIGTICARGGERWWPAVPKALLHGYVSNKAHARLGLLTWGQRVRYLCGIGAGYCAWRRGVFCTVLGTLGVQTLLILPSGLLRIMAASTYVQRYGWPGVAPTINSFTPRIKRGARLMRAKGQRPSVRGTVKNPNDHPHGGRTRAVR